MKTQTQVFRRGKKVATFRLVSIENKKTFPCMSFMIFEGCVRVSKYSRWSHINELENDLYSIHEAREMYKEAIREGFFLTSHTFYTNTGQAKEIKQNSEMFGKKYPH